MNQINPISPVDISKFAKRLLNETTCHWEAPIEKPTTYNLNLTDVDGNSYQDSYSWNETTKQWDVDNS